MRDDILPQVGQFSAAQYASTPIVPEGNWKLPAGHWVASNYPMECVAPRPDADREAWSRYNWAYPGIEYRVPICMLYGAYPFFYEVVPVASEADTSTAMILGKRAYNVGVDWWETEDWKQYGILRWTPRVEDVGKPFTLCVRVTTQALEQIDVTWSGVVDINNFIFVDSEAVSNGDGTINSPFNTLYGLFTNGVDGPTTKKMMYLRGRATPYGHVGTGTEWVRGPAAWMNYPGETPLLDTTQIADSGSIGYYHGGAELWVSGIKMEGMPAGVPNTRFINSYVTKNAMFWENICLNFMSGTPYHDDNGSWLAIQSTRVPPFRNNIVIKNCIGDGYDTQATDHCRFFTFYSDIGVLIEGNV